MSHRVVEIAWTPASATQWQTFTACRLEAARLWNDMVVRHARIRRLSGHLNGRYEIKWPTKKRLVTWVKRRYPNLQAQSAQQTVFDFLNAVYGTTALRKTEPTARYPWRTPKYRDVIYTNQSARIRDGFLVLPNGKSGSLRVKMPKNLELPGRVMEVGVAFGVVRLMCEVADLEPSAPSAIVGVDLGVNTLIAAGDGERAVVVSGREAKATIQWRAKNLASISSEQSKLTKGSRRWRRLQRRKLKMLMKAKSRVKDIAHKATRIVATAFPDATVVVGKPFNDAAKKVGRKQAQQVSQACNAKIIAQLAYKMNGARQVDEHYTSQTCPVCGERRRCGRSYECKSCGFVGPRDVVGQTNIRSIGLYGKMVFPAEVPKQIAFVRPLRKYPGARLQVVPAERRHVVRRAA